MSSEQLKSKLKKALTYPASVLFFTALITLGLLLFVMPQFQVLFANFNATLPMATRCVIGLTNYLKSHFLPLLITSIGFLLFGLYGYRYSYHLKRWLQNRLFNFPFIGAVYRLKLLAEWTAVLALTLTSGIRLQEGLFLANNTLTHLAIKESCQQLGQQVGAGYKLHQALTHTRLFNAADCYLIEMGEASTTLPIVLTRLSQEAHAIIAFKLDHLTQWIEPVIMLLLACVAGGLIITMYLPIFKIGTLL